jgi:hypothetical protein
MSRIDATFGLNNIKAVVDVNYDLSGASFVFPPQEGSNSEGITPSAKRESCIYVIVLTVATLYPTQSIQLNNRGDDHHRPTGGHRFDVRGDSPSHPAN